MWHEQKKADVNHLLVNARVLEAEFNLTEWDIEQLDLFNPVYIQKYRAWFYISKISNFVAGKLTKVELIKIA